MYPPAKKIIRIQQKRKRGGKSIGYYKSLHTALHCIHVPATGSLDDAKKRCDNDAECKYLHDYDNDDENWRTCSYVVFAADGKGAALTKQTPVVADVVVVPLPDMPVCQNGMCLDAAACPANQPGSCGDVDLTGDGSALDWLHWVGQNAATKSGGGLIQCACGLTRARALRLGPSRTTPARRRSPGPMDQARWRPEARTYTVSPTAVS